MHAPITSCFVWHTQSPPAEELLKTGEL